MNELRNIISYSLPHIVFLATIFFFHFKDKNKKINESVNGIILKFSFVYSAIFAGLVFLSGTIFKEFFFGFIRIHNYALPVFFISFIIWRLIQGKQHSIHLNLDPYKDLKDIINTIVGNPNFIESLRKGLPTGQDDKNYGFDFIPFIKDQIEQQKDEYEQSAKLFLKWTIGLGILFIVIISYLGFIIINDTFTESNQVLKEVNSKLEDLTQELRLQNPTLTNNKTFESIKSELLDYNSFSDSRNLKIEELIQTIQVGIYSAIKSNDVDILIDTLSEVANQIPEEDLKFKNLISNSVISLQDFKQDQQNATIDIRNTLGSLSQIIGKKEKILESNGVKDLIKRLSISIVIASFFLSILRFLAGLYRNHHNKMVSAQNDIIDLFKFYVGYKSSPENSKERKVVYEQFMHKYNISSEVSLDTSDKTEQKLSKQEIELFKSIISQIIKRP